MSVIDTPKKSDGGVNYYQHFRKDFIRPYGLAHSADAFDDTTLAKRLKPINCEFMLRPHIAFSEFCETITENCKYVSENLDIFEVEANKKFLGKVESVFDLFQVVNQKDTTRSGETDFNDCFLNLFILENVYTFSNPEMLVNI